MKNLKRILSFFIVMGFMFVMFGFRVWVKATNQTWDLTTNSYSSASTSTVTWTSTCVTMTLTKTGSSTNANNYLGGNGNAHTRVYKDQTLTFTCVNNYEINSISLTATSEDYATTAKNGAWTNASAVAEGAIVTVTPTDGEANVLVKFGAATRFTSVTVTYTSLSQEQIVLISSNKNNLLIGESALQLTTTTENINNIVSDVWTSSNTNVATVSSTGLVTPVALGTTNITRTVNGTASNSVTLKVWPSNASNISVATAIAIAEFTGTSDSEYSYTCSGTVKTVETTKNFILTDGNDDILIFGKVEHNLSVGMQVVVTGPIKNYRKNEIYTPEFVEPTLGYSVSFDCNGGTPSYDTITGLASGAKVSNPGTPTKDGYNFAGWYNGNNEWDFDTDTVTTSITLIARWASNAAQTAINNKLESINAYMSLAYTYNISSLNNISTFTKATRVSHLTEGDEIILVSNVASTYYALNSSITDNVSQGTIVNVEDEQIQTADSSCVWTLYGNAKDGWVLKNGDKYLRLGSSGISTNNSSGTAFTFVNNSNKNSCYLAAMISGTEKTPIYNTTYKYKAYATSNIAGNNYASETYVFVKKTAAKSTFSDVDFRIRCAIDEGIAELNEDLAVTFGIEVSAGGNTVKYANGIGDSFQTVGGKQFVTLDLNDMLNEDYDKLDTEFTVRAYVEYQGAYFYSTNSKTYSVKGMVENYYKVQHIDDVSGLKEILENYGYTFD